MFPYASQRLVGGQVGEFVGAFDFEGVVLLTGHATNVVGTLTSGYLARHFLIASIRWFGQTYWGLVMQKRTPNTLLDRSVTHLLHRGGQCADEVFSLSIGNSDITPRQYAVLSVVAKKEGVRQTDIAHATGIDRSTVTNLVTRLVKRGWLQRRRTKADTRAYAVRLTPAGRMALKIGKDACVEVDEKVLAALSAKQHAQFMEALGTIVQELGAQNSSA
jgi:DNA-binding MarR family transcriptional regulator